MQRRDFLKTTAATAASAFVGPTLAADAQDLPVVYFTKTISPEKTLELFKKLEIELPGKTAVKIHSGEPGGNHFLKPDFIKPLVDAVEGTLVESNTAYRGRRHRTEDHWKASNNTVSPKSRPATFWTRTANSNSRFRTANS